MSTATAVQLEALLEFMQANQDLARERLLRNIEGKVRAKQLWSEITTLLNGLGGCVKTTKQWQKVWADKNMSQKKLQQQSSARVVQQGGGPSSAPSLSETELKVLAIMGEGFGPASAACTYAFPQQGNIENISPNTQLAGASQCDLQIQEIQDGPSTDVIPTALITSSPATAEMAWMQPACSREPEGLPTPGNPSAHGTIDTHSRFTPRRKKRVQLDIRKKLIKMEEEKKAEIVALRKAVEKLSDTVAEAVTEIKNLRRSM